MDLARRISQLERYRDWSALVEELERLSADQGLGWSLGEGFKEKFLQGSDELALVRSGLDDTMRTAYQAMREISGLTNVPEDPGAWQRTLDAAGLRTTIAR